MVFFCYLLRGVAPDPTLFFVLIQKRGEKRSRTNEATQPASSTCPYKKEYGYGSITVVLSNMLQYKGVVTQGASRHLFAPRAVLRMDTA